MTAVTRPARHKKPFPWKEALRILVLTLISLLMIFPSSGWFPARSRLPMR